jgi:chloride channel protein, CIC family
MPAAMKVTQEPDFGPRPEREHGSQLVLALLAFAVGGTSGLLGALFRLVLERSDRFRGAVIDWAHGKEITGFALVIGISAIATGLAAWLVRKFAPGAKGSGIPDVEAALHEEQQPPPSLTLIPVKFVGGVLAMGAGLALGREGPTVQMGAGIGHFLATAFRRNQDDVKALLAAGAGAGLATAFSAPVAGAVFVLEELVRRFDTRITVTTLCASGSAIAVARLLLGNGPDFQLEPLPYSGFGTVPIFLVLGALTGLMGVAYNHVLLGALAAAERLGRWLSGRRACRDGRCSCGVARVVWARISQWRRRDHAAHARRRRQHDGCRRCVPGTIRPRAGVLRRRGAGRIVCAHAGPWGSKRSCPWEHSSAAGSLTWLNAQQPLPLSAWPRSSRQSCVPR